MEKGTEVGMTNDSLLSRLPVLPNGRSLPLVYDSVQSGTIERQHRG